MGWYSELVEWCSRRGGRGGAEVNLLCSTNALVARHWNLAIKAFVKQICWLLNLARRQRVQLTEHMIVRHWSKCSMTGRGNVRIYWIQCDPASNTFDECIRESLNLGLRQCKETSCYMYASSTPRSIGCTVPSALRFKPSSTHATKSHIGKWLAFTDGIAWPQGWRTWTVPGRVNTLRAISTGNGNLPANLHWKMLMWRINVVGVQTKHWKTSAVKSSS